MEGEKEPSGHVTTSTGSCETRRSFERRFTTSCRTRGRGGQSSATIRGSGSAPSKASWLASWRSAEVFVATRFSVTRGRAGRRPAPPERAGTGSRDLDASRHPKQGRPEAGPSGYAVHVQQREVKVL